MTAVDRQLGKYRVLEPIASGGMARVYRAIQPPLDRVVAIKVLRRVEDNPDELVRLRREAEALAAIRHPNVVQVLDYDVHDGQPFLVMELIDGETLHTLLLNGMQPLPIGAIARFGVEVLLAVDAIHQAGVIHRDLKPGNLLVTRSGKVVVADFGIALRAEDSHAVPAHYLTGTASFMAPELGLHGQASRASDLYAVGVLLYQLTTGQLPYAADTPRALIRAHADLPIPEPATHRPNLPPSLAAVIKRALAKLPGDRYASAGDMRLALEEALASAAIPLPPAFEPPETAWIPPVVSGADRDQLTRSSWTDEDTLIGRGSRSRIGLGQSVFIALAALFVVHGVVVATAGMLGRLIFVASIAWPVEIFWVALFFSLMQRARPKAGFLIVAVPALLIGMLFSYFTVTQNWHEWWWWLFAAVAIFSVVITLATRPNRERVIATSATIQIFAASALSLATLLFGFLRPTP
jgi:serine/threonine protein kinase